VIRDVNGLAGKLNRLSHVRLEAVIMKNMAQIYNRGKADGGTPVSTEKTSLVGHTASCACRWGSPATPSDTRRTTRLTSSTATAR
jgi:hypothetical protein